MRYYWSQRASLTASQWVVNFLVRLDGRVIGNQGIGSRDFAITREVYTGSWIGKAFQGKGIGTEMCAAVLQFAFDHLGALTARSAAWLDNAASLGTMVQSRFGWWFKPGPAPGLRPKPVRVRDGGSTRFGSDDGSAQVAGVEGVAPGRVAGLVAGAEPPLPLRGCAVGEGVRVYPATA
jgi:GNAT superfamily N-acetyltransferase